MTRINNRRLARLEKLADTLTAQRQRRECGAISPEEVQAMSHDDLQVLIAAKETELGLIDRQIAALEAGSSIVESSDQLANYLRSRFRHLEFKTDEELRQMWIGMIGLSCRHPRRGCWDIISDCELELSLRGIQPPLEALSEEVLHLAKSTLHDPDKTRASGMACASSLED
jgi:hypothetical protein